MNNHNSKLSAVTSQLNPRPPKIPYYLNIADSVSERSTCLRRRFGAIIVKNDEIVATGYNGAPRGRKNCTDCGGCLREKLGIPSGKNYELCRSVHAEANCIISAGRRETLGADLYLSCRDAKSGETNGNVEPCTMCKRLIINAGLSRVFIKKGEDEYGVIDVSDFVENDDDTGFDGYGAGKNGGACGTVEDCGFGK